MFGRAAHWLRVFLVRGAAVFLLLAATQFVLNSDSRARYDDLRTDLDRVRQAADELAIENEHLRLQVQGIQHDDRYLEQVARQELGMIGSGEVLYQFTD